MNIDNIRSYPTGFNPSENASPAQKHHAMAHVLLTQASKAASVAAPTPVGDTSSQINNSFEALKDMAAIDTLAYKINNFATLYPNGTAAQKADLENQAIALANDLMKNCNNTCLDQINQVISGSTYLGGMARNFTMTNGVVTAINFTQYDSDWTGTADGKGNVGGMNLIWSGTGGEPSIFKDPSIFKEWGLTTTNPSGLTDLFVFLSNCMMCKTATEGFTNPSFDTFMWGTSYGGVTLAQFFPVMATLSTYQLDEENTSPPGSLEQFITDMQSLQNMLPTDTMIQAANPGVSTTNYDTMMQGFTDPNTGIIPYLQNNGPNPTIPPPSWLAEYPWLPTPPVKFGSFIDFSGVYTGIAQMVIDKFLKPWP